MDGKLIVIDGVTYVPVSPVPKPVAPPARYHVSQQVKFKRNRDTGHITGLGHMQGTGRGIIIVSLDHSTTVYDERVLYSDSQFQIASSDDIAVVG